MLHSHGIISGVTGFPYVLLLVMLTNLDHLVKVVFAGHFHCKVTMISPVVNKYVGGRCFETVQIRSLLKQTDSSTC